MIVSGNRRYVACRMVGFTHMDAIVLPAAGAGCTDQELLRCLSSGQMHYLEEAEALSDRIGIMVNGHLTALGSAAELIAQAGASNFEDAFIALAAKEGVPP